MTGGHHAWRAAPSPVILPGFRIVAPGRMAPSARRRASRERGGGELAQAGARGLPPGGRPPCAEGGKAEWPHHAAVSRGRVAPACHATPQVIRIPCQVALSRGKVAPSARGALRAPLIDSEESPHGQGTGGTRHWRADLSRLQAVDQSNLAQIVRVVWSLSMPQSVARARTISSP